MHNFEISMCCTSSFFLFTNYKRDISHFLVVSPCLVTLVLPPCFTAVCNPVVLPRPRVEVLELFPRCVSPWNEKWETFHYYLFHSTSIPFNSKISIPREKTYEHKCQLFCGGNSWRYVFIATVSWIVLNRDLLHNLVQCQPRQAEKWFARCVTLWYKNIHTICHLMT